MDIVNGPLAGPGLNHPGQPKGKKEKEATAGATPTYLSSFRQIQYPKPPGCTWWTWHFRCTRIITFFPNVLIL